MSDIAGMPTTDFICAVGRGLHIIPTGDWKVYPPAIDQAKCKHCGSCLFYCPTNSVRFNGKDYSIDLEYCKGCGVCIQECQAGAIYFDKEDASHG